MRDGEGVEVALSPFVRAAEGVALIADAVAAAARANGPEEAALIAETALRMVLESASAARAAQLAALVAAETPSEGAPRDAA